MFHRPIFSATVDVVRSIFEENRYADKSIEYAFRNNRKWGSRDRKFVAESVFEVVRWWRKLLYVTDQVGDSEVKNRVNYWHVLGAYWFLKSSDLPDWPEFQEFDKDRVLANNLESKLERKLRESIPNWLDERGSRELGEKWELTLQELNREAPVFLRVNLIKTSVTRLIQDLAEEDIEVSPVKGVEGALCLPVRKPIFKTKAFSSGLFEVQDLSSQLVAPFLNPKPGDWVIDACAGAGGKSLHLANFMKNKGKLIALDIHEHKLKELRKRSSRNGVDVIECRTIDSTKVIKRLHQKGDSVLLDVPCSGLGVLRRNPDTKWKCSNEEISRLIELQRDLLCRYSQMVKPGGVMVYSTCSILPSENQEQVEWFLKSELGQDFSRLDEKTILPVENRGDGFYMCKLERRS